MSFGTTWSFPCLHLQPGDAATRKSRWQGIDVRDQRRFQDSRSRKRDRFCVQKTYYDGHFLNGVVMASSGDQPAVIRCEITPFGSPCFSSHAENVNVVPRCVMNLFMRVFLISSF